MKIKIKLTNLPELTVTHPIKEIADGVWFVEGVFSFIIFSKKVRDAMTNVRDAYRETYVPCEVIQ